MYSTQKGFTLIELMVTLAVLAVVASVAVPSFSTMINNNRSVTLAEDMAGALNYARSEAVKRSTNVTLCASADGSACDGTWTDHWIVFVDTASENAAIPVVGGVLRQWQPPGGNAVVSAKQNSVDVGFVRFTGKGLLGVSASGSVEINSSVSGCAANAGRTLTIGIAGVVSVARNASGCS